MTTTATSVYALWIEARRVRGQIASETQNGAAPQDVKEAA